MKKVILFVSILLVIITTIGCGGSSKVTTVPTTPDITPDNSPATDVLGAWMVQGQSAMQYAITFYADNTFHLIYKGTKYEGNYTISGDSVTLNPHGGPQITLKKTGDTLVGDLTWIRI